MVGRQLARVACFAKGRVRPTTFLTAGGRLSDAKTIDVVHGLPNLSTLLHSRRVAARGAQGCLIPKMTQTTEGATGGSDVFLDPSPLEHRKGWRIAAFGSNQVSNNTCTRMRLYTHRRCRLSQKQVGGNICYRHLSHFAILPKVLWDTNEGSSCDCVGIRCLLLNLSAEAL
jgi:hypothetical protein